MLLFHVPTPSGATLDDPLFCLVSILVRTDSRTSCVWVDFFFLILILRQSFSIYSSLFWNYNGVQAGLTVLANILLILQSVEILCRSCHLLCGGLI